MKRTKRWYIPGAALAVLLAALMALMPPGMAEEAPQYVRDEWNYVEDSMDVSGGIPEDATGRLGRIRALGRLTVATEPYFPPQEFIDESRTGQERYVGADMELARLIAERMGVELQIVPLEFTDVLTGVADGKYDLAISALSFTSGRAAVMEMSKGYYFTSEQASSGLVIREADAEKIRSVEDLSARDIVAQSGSLQESMAVENIPFYRKFRRLPAVNDVFATVMADKADAGILDVENARTYINNHPGCGLMIVPDVYFDLQPQFEGDRVAAPKGELELICFVNGVIDEVVASGQYERWFDEYARYDAAR